MVQSGCSHEIRPCTCMSTASNASAHRVGVRASAHDSSRDRGATVSGGCTDELRTNLDALTEPAAQRLRLRLRLPAGQASGANHAHRTQATRPGRSSWSTHAAPPVPGVLGAQDRWRPKTPVRQRSSPSADPKGARSDGSGWLVRCRCAVIRPGAVKHQPEGREAHPVGDQREADEQRQGCNPDAGG